MDCNRIRKAAGIGKLTKAVNIFRQLHYRNDLVTTAIYFLLQQNDFSAFHRIKSDECWHFYAGDPLVIYVIKQDGNLYIITLGDDISNGQLFQYIVPANCWFASRPAADSNWCFVGCTVAPGFDFADFELADALALSALYPDHKNIILQLCQR